MSVFACETGNRTGFDSQLAHIKCFKKMSSAFSQLTGQHKELRRGKNAQWIFSENNLSGCWRYKTIAVTKRHKTTFIFISAKGRRQKNFRGGERKKDRKIAKKDRKWHY